MIKRDKSGLKASQSMFDRQRNVRTRYPLWGSNLEQDTTEVLPGVLWFVLGMYIGWFALFLVQAIDNKPIKAEGLYHGLIVFRAIVGGVVPILGAYIVGSDKSWGQWFVPLSFFLLFLASASRAYFNNASMDWTVVATGVLFSAVSALVIFSPITRQFYRGVRENECELRP